MKIEDIKSRKGELKLLYAVYGSCLEDDDLTEEQKSVYRKKKEDVLTLLHVIGEEPIDLTEDE